MIRKKKATGRGGSMGRGGRRCSVSGDNVTKSSQRRLNVGSACRKRGRLHNRVVTQSNRAKRVLDNVHEDVGSHSTHMEEEDEVVVHNEPAHMSGEDVGSHPDPMEEEALHEEQGMDREDIRSNTAPMEKAPQEEQGFPGGPKQTDLLEDYYTHIARLIWSEVKVDKILKVHRRGKWMKFWDQRIPVDPVVPVPWLTVAQRSGLTSLRDLHWDHVDHVLLSAFVERWYPETNTFHFPWGEMTITLHDVACLLGLPIDGEELAMSWDEGHLRSTMTNMFGWTAEELAKYYEDGGIPLDLLNNKLDEMIKESGPAEDIASGFLLNLLGCTLFVDKTTQKVKHRIMGLVSDHGRTGKYAWGAGVLACLYRSLGEASRSGAAQLAGCALLLERWIWMYFPVFRGHLVTDPVRRADLRFAARYESLGTPRKNKERLKQLRQQLDTFRVEDVEWMPFGRNLDFAERYRVSMYEGTIQFLGKAEKYAPQRVVRQFGRVQGVPTDEIKPYDRKRKDKIKPYVVEFEQKHNHWATRYEHLHPILQLPLTQMPWDVDEEYPNWFLQRSHPYLLPTSTHQPPPTHSPLDLSHRVRLLMREIRAYTLRGEAIPVEAQLRLTEEFYGPDGPP